MIPLVKHFLSKYGDLRSIPQYSWRTAERGNPSTGEAKTDRSLGLHCLKSQGS